MEKVLVTGASRRATLTIVRSLGRRAIYTAVGDYSPVGTAFFSKYCGEKFIYTNPQTNPREFFRDILSKIKTGEYHVLFPVHDMEIFPILKNKDIVEKYTLLPFVDFDTFMKTVNKWETVLIAKKAGVNVPQTYHPENRSDLNRIKKEIKFPVVIKPITQTVWDPVKGVKTRHVLSKNYVHNEKEFENFFKNVKNVQEYLIQEYVKGKGGGASFLFNHGKMRAAFSYMRLREYPITGGPSTLRISIKNEKMIELGKKLLEQLKWHGVAMVEFKLTSEGPVLMEINGRFWGSLALPYHAGVDFPYLLYKLAIDGDVPPITDYKVGVLCRWLIPGDILNFYFRLKANREDNSHVFKEFFKFRGMYYDHIDLDDPLPTVGALVTSARYFWSYLRGKRTIAGEYR